MEKVLKNKNWALLALVLLFLLHLPFLASDPNLKSFSRDAFTDEGLYSGQIRNYINFGSLNINESDALVKTPLFSFILFLPLKTFGIHLETARLTVLFFCFLIFAFLSRKEYFNRIILISTALVLFQPGIFAYSHFALPEMLCSAFMLLSIFYMVEFLDRNPENRSLKNLFLSCFFSALAYYTKIQFLYLSVLPIVTILIYTGYRSLKDKTFLREGLKISLLAVGFTSLFLALYYVAWYLPNKDLVDYVLSEQSANRYPLQDYFWSVIYNFKNYFFIGSSQLYFYCFLTCLIPGIFMLFKSANAKFRYLFIITLYWIVLELHKLPMSYLPPRYLVSLYFAVGIFMVNVLSESINFVPNYHFRKTIRVFAFATIIALFGFNSWNYYKAYGKRVFHIKEINQYLSKRGKDKIIIGSWAAGLTWDSKSFTYPVWRDYFNDKFLIKSHADAVISEVDEEDSNQAFRYNNINLIQSSDSLKHIQIGNWKACIYWLKK